MSYFQSVTNLTSLDALWFKAGTGDDQKCIPIHVLTSKLRLPICCVFPAVHTGRDFVNSFLHIRKMTIFQSLKDKIGELTNMIDFGDFSHSL